jgi:predicted nucleic acid-binding protein
MFLIDTMVLSELRRRRRDPGVVAWIRCVRQEDCFLSVVSIGEIERGIVRQRAVDPLCRLASAPLAKLMPRWRIRSAIRS